MLGAVRDWALGRHRAPERVGGGEFMGAGAAGDSEIPLTSASNTGMNQGSAPRPTMAKVHEGDTFVGTRGPEWGSPQARTRAPQRRRSPTTIHGGATSVCDYNFEGTKPGVPWPQATEAGSFVSSTGPR